jgi:hypothetical protein
MSYFVGSLAHLPLVMDLFEQVLRKTGDKKKLRDSDEFSVNMDFKEKKKVLQIVAPLFE